MKRLFKAGLCSFFIFMVQLPGVHRVYALDTELSIPEKVQREDKVCRELDDLIVKYDATKLSDATLLEKKELAASLLSILERVVDKCEKEGPDAVPREDLDRITSLYEALKDDLAQYEGYQERREAIEKILAKPEEPSFLYKFGANGFLRGEGAGNFSLPDFSYAPQHGEGRFLYRVKPYVYWHPTDYLDLHLEGQGYGYDGGGQHKNLFSLYQGFVEAKLPQVDWLALKGGRQEFVYGSTFILGANTFYQGLSFDAGRLRIRPIEHFTVDLLGGAYATPFSFGVKGTLVGAYATYGFTEGNAVELYLLRDTGSNEHHSGEYLLIWGVRGTAKTGPVSLEFEPVYESGHAFNTVSGGNDRIDAYGGHLDVTAESVIAGYNNKFFLSYAIGSGSGDAVNGVTAAKEFRNPNNDTSLVGDMSVVGDLSGVTVNNHHASGLQVYTLGWGIDLSKALNFSATGHYFTALRVENGFSRNLGLEADFSATYTVNDGLSVIVGYDHFFTGRFFRDASGSGNDINYGYLMLQFDLSKSKPKASGKGKG